MYGLRHKRVACANSQKRSFDPANFQRSSAGLADSQRSIDNHVNPERNDGDAVNSQMSNEDGGSNDGATDMALAKEDAPKRGRGERRRTKLRLPSRDGKVQLRPIGST